MRRLKSTPRGRSPASLDHLVGAGEQRGRDGEAERLGGVQVDRQLEFGRLLDGQVCRVRTLENPSDENAVLVIDPRQAGSVADQTASRDGFAPLIARLRAIPP